MFHGIRSVLTVFSVLMAVASICTLVISGFRIGINAPLEMALRYYDALIAGLLGWADNPLSSALDAFGRWVNLEITLHPHWRHTFVLVLLYVGNDVRAEVDRKRYGSAIFAGLLGVIVALAAALSTGSVIEEESAIVGAITATICFVVYEFLRAIESATLLRRSEESWRQHFNHMSGRFITPTAAIGASVIALAWLAGGTEFHVPSFVWVLILIAALALRNIVQCAAYAIRTDRSFWLARFKTLYTAQVGVRVYVVIVATILVIGFGAGFPSTEL